MDMRTVLRSFLGDKTGRSRGAATTSCPDDASSAIAGKRAQRCMSTLSLMIITGATVLLSSCYLLRGSESYYGVQTSGENVVFLVDVSASMAGKDEGTAQDEIRRDAAEKAGDTVAEEMGGTVGDFIGGLLEEEGTKLGSAKRELIPAVRGMNADSRFAIVAFSRQLSTWQSGLMAASATNRNLAAAYLKSLSTDGGTAVKAAIERAFQFTAADVVFLVSDGAPTEAGTGEILRHVRRLNDNRGLVINTIGLGKDQDRSFLSALARQNGGKYIQK